MFYLPFDVGYKALKFMPVRLMCEALKEVYRAKMVHDGVSHAAKLFPNAYLVMVSRLPNGNPSYALFSLNYKKLNLFKYCYPQFHR